ncbi:MAG: hypothetical protein R2681_07380 [Pyrinomonadaceae bacterium]
MPNKLRIPAAILLSLLLTFSLNIKGQTGNPETADHSRELDFMVGNWDVSAKILTPQNGYISGSGTMKVRSESETLLAEMRIKFQNFESNGTTKRRYDKAGKYWNVSWNPIGQQPVLNIEGKMKDGRFIEIDYGRDNRGAYIGRLVVFNISTDRFSVRKDKIYDDGMIIPEIWMYEAVRQDTSNR